MSYCRVHNGLQYEYEDGCPKCRDDAEQAALDRSEIIRGLDQSREEARENIADVADAINNPGDYDCPHCKFRTLKKWATCCPRCQKDPGPRYWDGLREEERRAELRAKAAKEEWERAAPTRAAAARAAQEEWERTAPARAAAAKAKKRAARWAPFWIIYFLYLLPVLSVVTLGLVRIVTGPSLGQSAINLSSLLLPVVIFAIPALNWLMTFIVIIGSNSDGHGLFQCLIFWVIVGSLLMIVTKPQKK